MRVPVSWLNEYCDPGLAPAELAERLSMTGTEVERVISVGVASTDGFVVGHVISVEPHPGADRLSVCRVDTGAESNPRTIVCGAPNVAPGQTVAVALPGAVLPDGTELGQAKLRGVVSDGMILSEAELGIGDGAAGILVLDDNSASAGSGGDALERESAPGGRGPEVTVAPALAGAVVGTPLGEVLPIADSVLELEITPNRPDCLGVYGVARELHAATGAELAAPPWEDEVEATGDGEAGEHASVVVEVPQLCPRFTARVFTDVSVGPSPPWLRARLIAAGQRPINNVVDATNYAMLITAQPLHAFDLDRVQDGALRIRTAEDGEVMTTLDGVKRTFDAETVLVCDGSGPAAIAGIMGGEGSEVSESTSRLLLEVATWEGTNILRTSNILGLRSEASGRFEKQLHPALTLRAQAIASSLLVELCGARLTPGTIDVAAEASAKRQVQLRSKRVEGLLGMSIDPEDSATYLEQLGFDVERAGADLEVGVPADRYYDVSREADLIEEVARIHGLEHLPSTLPRAGNRSGRLARADALRRRAEDGLRDLGFSEIVSWSFTDAQLPDRLRIPADAPERRAIAVHNPLSEEGSTMRTTLIGGLLDAASYNLARGADRALLFESGRVYLDRPPPATGGPLAGVFPGRRPPPACEPHRLGVLAVGSIRPPAWHETSVGAAAEPVGGAGYFELRGVLEDVCRGLGVEPHLVASRQPFLHPGRAAAIELAAVSTGWIGELHPLVAREWDLPGGFAFELDLAGLTEAGVMSERFDDLTTYPAVYQDLAVVVSEGTPAEEVTDAVETGGGELLRSTRVFDLYLGDQVGPGMKSLALRLEFRASDRTLTDAEVAERREAIRGAVAEIGGSLRE